MMYRVNEIFTSLKGEGVHLGVPMNFIRLATCNLTCPKCDTTFNSPNMPMTVDAILDALQRQVKAVVITGGEPTVQHLEELLDKLHDWGYNTHLESNGTLPFPYLKFDWICISPKLKEAEPLAESIMAADEIKMPISTKEDLEAAEAFRSKYEMAPGVWFLHPWMDNFEEVRHGRELGPGSRTLAGWNNEAAQLCIDYAIKTGRWRLSLQAHKVWQVK